MDIKTNVKNIIFIFLIILFISFDIFINIYAYKNYKKYIWISITIHILFFLLSLSYKGFLYYKENKENIDINTNDYELITTAKDLYNKSSYWLPKEKIINGILYKPLGVIDNYNNNTPIKKSILVPDNQTKKPIDYTLIFKNDQQKLYAWSPKAEKDYVCLGDIVTNTNIKPSTDLIRCVPKDWVHEKNKQSDVSPYNTKNGSIWIGSYENSNYANLIKISNTSKKNLLPTYELKDFNN